MNQTKVSNPKAWIIGIIFRVVVMLWLVMAGVGILSTRSSWFDGWVALIKIIGGVFLLLSFYLFLNLYNKKITDERYIQWGVAAFALLVILPAYGFVFYVSSGFTDTSAFTFLKNLLTVAF